MKTLLRWEQRTVTVTEYDEVSFQNFRNEFFSQFFSRPCQVCGYLNEKTATECEQCQTTLSGKIKGIVFAKDVVDRLCMEKAKPVSARDFSDYANLIAAGCHALHRLMEELRDEYVHDSDGSRVQDADGNWLRKEPMVIFPITIKYEPAWGAFNHAEGFAIPEALPIKFGDAFKIRQKLVNGSRAALVKQMALLKQGRPDAPALLALLDEMNVTGLLDAGPDATREPLT